MGLLLLAFTTFVSPVTVQADSIRLDALVKELARQTGKPLECLPGVAAENVIIDVRDRPADEVMQRVAMVTGTEWTTSAGVQRLGRSASLLFDQKVAERKKLAAHLTELIKLSQAAEQKRTPLDSKQALIDADGVALNKLPDAQQEQEVHRISTDNPAMRAAMRLIAQIDPVEVTQLRSRVTFSDRPTAAQRALNPKAQTVIKDLCREIKVMQSAKAQLGKPKGLYTNYGDWPHYGTAKLDGNYGKTVFTLQRYRSCQFKFSLTVVDADGRSALRCESYWPALTNTYRVMPAHRGQPIQLQEVSRAFLDMNKDVGAAEAESTSIPLQGTTVHAGMYITAREKEGQPPLTGVQEMLADPVKNDPMGIVGGALLRPWAARLNRPLIATVDDYSLTVLMMHWRWGLITHDEDALDILEQRTTPTTERTPPLEELADPDYLLIRPFAPVSALASTFDRAAMKNLVQRMKNDGCLSMEAASEFYSSRTLLPTFGSLMLSMIEHAFNGVGHDQASAVFQPALRILSRLTPTQWQSALGAGIPLGALDSVSRRLVEDALLTMDYESYVPFRKGATPWDKQFPLDLEPTEIFPNGFPDSARVQLKKTESPVALGITTLGYGFTMTPPDFAYYEMMRKNPDHYASKRIFVGYHPGVQHGYTLQISLPKNINPSFGMRDTSALPGTSLGPRNSLPAAFLEQADKALKQLESRERPIKG